MKNKRQQLHMEGLVVLVLFGVFALCILTVLLTGVDAYGRLTKRQQATYAGRTVPQYIATRVRQADSAGAVQIGEFGGVEALELTEIIGGEAYITRIYCYDGYLWELFSAAAGTFEPADGERILEAEQVDFTRQENKLTVMVTAADGKKTELRLTLRSEEGGVQ